MPEASMLKRSRNHRTRLGLAALAVAATLLGGCGLFDVRDPLPPIGEIPRHIPNAPDSVLFNFTIGWQYRTSGVSQIAEAMAQNFVIRLDPADVLRLGVDSLHKVEVEPAIRSFLQSRVKANQVRFIFRTEGLLLKDQGSARYYDDLPYVMQIYTSTGGQEVVVDSLAGQVDLYFAEQSNSSWAIIDWRDSGGDSPAETYGYYVGFYAGVSAPDQEEPFDW